MDFGAFSTVVHGLWAMLVRTPRSVRVQVWGSAGSLIVEGPAGAGTFYHSRRRSDTPIGAVEGPESLVTESARAHSYILS